MRACLGGCAEAGGAGAPADAAIGEGATSAATVGIATDVEVVDTAGAVAVGGSHAASATAQKIRATEGQRRFMSGCNQPTAGGGGAQ